MSTLRTSGSNRRSSNNGGRTADYMDDMAQEEEERQEEAKERKLQREAKLREKNIVATFLGPSDYVNRVLYSDGTLRYASSEDADLHEEPFNQDEGYRILNQMVQEIVTEFGEGPVYVKACSDPSDGGQFYSNFADRPISLNYPGTIRICDPEFSFGGGDIDTGWYVTHEYCYSSFSELMKSWTERGNDDVFELDRALEAKKFGYKKSAIAEGSADERYRMY